MRRDNFNDKTRPEPEKPQDLIEHICIRLRLPHGGLYVWEFEKGGHELRVRVDGQLTYNTTTQMLHAALAGLGLAYVPEGLAQPHLGKGRLKRVLADWCLPYSGYHLTMQAAAIPHPHSPCWLMRCATEISAKRSPNTLCAKWSDRVNVQTF